MPATLFYLSYRALTYLSIVMRMRILENIHMREQNFHSHMYATWLSFTNKLQIHCSAHVWTVPSDRGQNRYSDFVALETLLRFENCSSSHCLLSSWRRCHVFESSHPSFHRTVFFGAPLAFLRFVAMGLCRRCVIFMSSYRRVFLSSTVLHTWVGTWCMGTYIVPTQYLHKYKPSIFCLVPSYSVTLLP